MEKPHIDPTLVDEYMEEGETWIVQVGTPDGQPSTDPRVQMIEARLALIDPDYEQGSHGHTYYTPLDRIDEVHRILIELYAAAQDSGDVVHDEFPIIG